jgi:hypothetical protein
MLQMSKIMLFKNVGYQKIIIFFQILSAEVIKILFTTFCVTYFARAHCQNHHKNFSNGGIH